MTTTTTDLQAMLRACVEAPEDDAARGAIADLYSEAGDEERGELVRVQVELAATDEALRVAGNGDEPIATGLPLFARGTALGDRERELLTDANLARWRRPGCGMCQGSGRIPVRWNSGLLKGGKGSMQCPTCRGQGSTHPLAEREDGMVIQDIHGRPVPITSRWKHAATLVRGLWCVDVPFDDMGMSSATTPWSFADDWLAWAIACVQFGCLFRVAGREPLQSHWAAPGGGLEERQCWGWLPYPLGDQRDQCRLPPPIYERIPNLLLDGPDTQWRWFPTPDAAHLALDRAVLALVCRAAWPDVKGETP